jgi:hypothetical protein
VDGARRETRIKLNEAGVMASGQLERIPRTCAVHATKVALTSGVRTLKRRYMSRTTGGGNMTEVKIYPAKTGGWMYVVLVANRPVVIGWCETRHHAEQQAALV